MRSKLANMRIVYRSIHGLITVTGMVIDTIVVAITEYLIEASRHQEDR